MSIDALAARIEDALDTRVRPLLKMHGGSIEVQEVTEEGHVRLGWLAGCVGCPMRALTTVGLVQPALEGLEGVTSVDTGSRVSPAAAARLRNVAGRGVTHERR